MCRLYLYSIVSVAIFSLVSSESGSSKPLLQKRNAFMSHTDSKGNVHSMSSGGSSGNSFMINSDSNGKVQGLIDNGNGVPSTININSNDMDFGELDLASILNSHLEIPLTDDLANSYILPTAIFYGSESPSGTRRVTFSDGSFVYVSDPSAKGVNTQLFQQSAYHFPQYQYNHQSSSSHNSRLANPVATGTAPGTSAAPGSTLIITGGNGADAADGGADGSVMVQATGNGRANVLTNGKSSGSFIIGKRRRRET